jgi:hypothetical protein
MACKQFSAANTAIKGKGILAGKWVEKTEIGGAGEYDNLNDDELERQIMDRVAQFERGTQDDAEETTH